MKRSILSVFVLGATLTMLNSCGETYKPMTEEQISAKAAEQFATEGQAAVDAAKAECAAGMEAAVDAKVAEMLAAPAAPAI